MDWGECVAATVVAAVTSAAGAVAACADAAACTLPKPHDNILTLTGLEFSAMLSDPRYDEWFRLNLRCGQDSFVRLCDVLRGELQEFELDRFVKDHSFEEKVACLLYFLGSQGGYREAAAAFAISKSWAIDVIGVDLRVLRRSLRIESAFKAKGGIPGVVGAIDGSLLEINRPDDFEGYYCRKMFPALNLQAVLRYNYLHSRTRMAVECAFGLWKGRFRIVNCCLNTKAVEKAVDIIAATMVLHNILLDIKDGTSFEEEKISNIKIDEDNSASSTATDATARFLREVGSRKRESLLDFTEGF
ncbi:DDE superfamily endonuclease [Phytophthora infestans]|uniref:DDE superfamily endonuclease n=1 Tax=Phytophthora infestans TaxID=4787 RepID=A0A8S9U444_PHYIN|nr:DDE superfamily endonuclease [Phytophthora infestans]